MSKLLKVTLEFDDKTMTIEGEEAEKWDKHITGLASLADIHGMNPFDTDPVRWQVEVK
jgi:hypothetical protein